MTLITGSDPSPIDAQLDNFFSRHVIRPLRWPFIKTALRKAMAVDGAAARLKGLEGRSGFDAVDTFVSAMAVPVHYENTGDIPRNGALLVVANHPVGAADVFFMLQCLHHARDDVRVVINKIGPVLVPQIAELCLPVDRYSSFTEEARARIEATLRSGLAVILFPAGGISKPTWRGIRDHRWKHGAVHFSRATNADVLPVHISGRSSLLFLALPRKLRHFLVAREMMHPVKQSIRVRVGEVIPAEAVAAGDVAEATARLERAVYALAKNG